jgi:hypothetical protein
MIRPVRAHSVAAYSAVAAAGLAGFVVGRRAIGGWGATGEEVARALPGDDEVPRAQIASTRAIPIHAPATAVWPWLVQMGWKTADWYSYDRIDNDRIPSAERIIPELQALQIGDLVAEGAEVGWTVEALEPNRLLLLTAHAPMSGVDWVRRRDSSWLFLLEESGSEDTRLIERSRTALTMNEHAAGKAPRGAFRGAAARAGRLRYGAAPDAGDQTPGRTRLARGSNRRCRPDRRRQPADPGCAVGGGNVSVETAWTDLVSRRRLTGWAGASFSAAWRPPTRAVPLTGWERHSLLCL